MPEESQMYRRIFRYLIAGTAILVGANIANEAIGRPFWTVTRLIYLGYDNNLAAWYSSMLLVVAGLLSYICSVRAKTENLRGAVSFLLLAGLLVAMSADEISMIHEGVGDLARDRLNLSSSDLTKHSPLWIISPFIIAIFVGFIVLLRKALAAAPGSLFSLALGFASIVLGGVVLETTINFLNHDELAWVWTVENIAEEALEMAGTLFIIRAVLIWSDEVAGTGRRGPHRVNVGAPVLVRRVLDSRPEPVPHEVSQGREALVRE
ncbi:MAG: hypothetical protein ACYTGZ_00340 [Planctomycetota bacterium]|jgi:hypothetical protein